MGFEAMLTEEQRELQQMVREFAQKEVKPVCREMEKTGDIPWDLVKKANDMGLPMLTMPEEFGGIGASNMTYAVVREELCKGDAGFASVVMGFGFTPVQVAGTRKQQEMVAEIIRNGGACTFALTESHAGSDAAAIRTRAVKEGGEYIINGSKCFISLAPIAEMHTVFAVTDPEKRGRGVTAFLIPKGMPGLHVGKHEDKMGMRVAPVAELVFDEVRIPEEYRLGEEGEGFKVAMRILDHSRPSSGVGAVGIAQAALDEAIAYAKEREVFGHPIKDYQGISFMIADMEIQVQAARQLVWNVCRLADSGVVDAKLSAAAKCFSSDVAMKVTTDAVQVFGGNGYSREYPVEKLMRDAKIFQIFEGTNQIQRMTIAKSLFR